MPKYIFRARSGLREQLDASLKAHPEIRIVEEASPRMVLVEGPEEVVRMVGQESPGWLAVRETETPMPDTRERLE